ncbi:MAG TPA: hypothetical protein VFB32_00900 [Rudaea sp.]|nr:hypothetical protein [Rudaea sp.]
MQQDLPSRWHRLAADAFGLWLAPLAAAVLPGRAGYALARRCARSERLYRDAVDAAWAVAQRYCTDADVSAWKYRYRLLRLVDHVDSYSTLLHGARWWRHRIDRQGEWPVADGPRVFLTYHWGAGHWIWRELQAAGFHASFLARRPEGRALGVTRLSHWYGAFRAWALPRIGSRGPLFVGGSRDAIAEALRAGTSIVGMLDLPAAAQQRAIELPFAGRRVRFPIGLTEIAVAGRFPVTLFAAGLDVATGRRRLWIENLDQGAGIEEVMRRYAALLEARVAETPEFWQLWREAPAMFVMPA